VTLFPYLATRKLIFINWQFENVPPEHFQGILFRTISREGGLVRPPSKSCRFSHPPLRVPEYGTGCFVACGRRQGLLALDLGSIFEKLLHQKTFILVTSKNLFQLYTKGVSAIWQISREQRPLVLKN
jgi:hypothetical protein